MQNSALELNKAFEEIEKNAQRREREAAKQHQSEVKEINASIDELRASSDLEPFRKQLKDQALEDKRLSLAIQDVQPKIEEALKQIEAGLNISKESEETNRQNLKQITDIQAEMAAIRKHADEARDKTTLHSDSIRNLENRITELIGIRSRAQRSTDCLSRPASSSTSRTGSCLEGLAGKIRRLQKASREHGTASCRVR